MQRNVYAKLRNVEIRAWVEEHPEIKERVEAKIRNVPTRNSERAFINAAKTEAMNQTVRRRTDNGIRAYFRGSLRTAQRYMRLAASISDPSFPEGLSLRQVYFLLGIVAPASLPPCSDVPLRLSQKQSEGKPAALVPRYNDMLSEDGISHVKPFAYRKPGRRRDSIETRDLSECESQLPSCLLP